MGMWPTNQLARCWGSVLEAKLLSITRLFWDWSCQQPLTFLLLSLRWLANCFDPYLSCLDMAQCCPNRSNYAYELQLSVAKGMHLAILSKDCVLALHHWGREWLNKLYVHFVEIQRSTTAVFLHCAFLRMLMNTLNISAVCMLCIVFPIIIYLTMQCIQLDLSIFQFFNHVILVYNVEEISAVISNIYFLTSKELR